MAGAGLDADEKLGRVDFCPGSAAGDVHHRLVAKPAPAGYAELAARGDKPPLLRLGDPVGPAVAAERHEADLEVLALFVRRHAVDFRSNAPHAHLKLPAASEAAADAGELPV